MLRMCRGLRTNKQQEDSPELTLANSEMCSDLVGNSTLSANTLLDSGISSSDRWIKVPLT